VSQKGVDLVLDIIDTLLEQPVQMVMLGSGDPALEEQLRAAAQRYPKQLSVTVGYDEQTAHRIEAGADALLMPSRYEPCGLNQMYSQLYGTVPIVRRTGGLADTVVDFNEQTLGEHTATGFCFDEDNPEALLATCLGALHLFRNDRVDWWKLVIAGMHRDFSWTSSAARYSELYKQLIQNRGEDSRTTGLDRPAGPSRASSAQQTGQRLH